MPGLSKKDKEKLNVMTAYLDGKYVPFNGFFLAERAFADTDQLVNVIAPDIRQEWFDYYFGVYIPQAGFSTTGQAYGLMKKQGVPQMIRTDTDIEAEHKMIELNRKINKRVKDYIDGLEGAGQEFAPWLEAMRSNIDHEKGDLTRALNDSPVIMGLRTAMTYGPLLKTKKVAKTDEEIRTEAEKKKIPVSKVDREKDVIDFELMKKGLGKAFGPYMEIFRDYNALLALEYEKQKIEDGYTDIEAEADFAIRYRNQLEKAVKDFNTLKQIEIDNRYVYGTEFLNNKLDELVGVTPTYERTIENEIAHTEGRAKAIENGWQVEDSSVPGIISGYAAYLEKEEKILESNIQKYIRDGDEASANKTRENLKSVQQAFSEAKALKEECYNKKIENPGDCKELIGKYEALLQKYTKGDGHCAELTRGYDDIYNDMLAEVKERLYAGRSARLGSERGKYNLDRIYGIKSGEYPFNEAETAALGLGGTLGDTNNSEREAFLDAALGSGEKAGTLDAIGEYTNLAETGKQNAKSAMEQYVKGDKRPLAVCIYNGCFAIQEKLREEKRIGGNAATYSVLLNSYRDMLKRDPGLYNELKEYNNTLPEDKKLDFDELKKMRIFSEIVLQGNIAKNELKKPGFDPTPLQRGVLIKRSVKADVVNDLLQNVPGSPQAGEFLTPEGQKKLDDFAGKMILKYGIDSENRLKWNSNKILAETAELNNRNSSLMQENDPGFYITAAEYIENLRDNKFSTLNTSYINDEVKKDYGDKFLKIIAARELAGVDRNQPDKLRAAYITPQMVDERVAAMKNDSIYRGFIDDINNSRYKMITAVNGARMVPGHGGKLSDMLKDYMLNLPPGELKNDKQYERYMPDADKRIESLKKQAENLQKKNPASREESKEITDRLIKAVAEIVVIRNLIQAEAGNRESIGKKLTASNQDIIKEKVDMLVADEGFRNTALNRDVQSLLLKGHGGKMSAKVRELYSERLDKDERLCEIIEENTIERRMEHLKQEAGRIAQSIREAKAGSREQRRLAKTGKDLMEEYSLLYAKVVDPDTFAVEQAKLKNDVPWGKVNELKTKDTVFTQKFRHVTGYFEVNDVTECLEAMATQNLDTFKNTVNSKINDINAKIKAQNNPQNQAENQAERRQQPNRKK